MASHPKLTLDLLLAAMDRMKNGFAVYDTNFGLLYANPVARSYFPVLFEAMEDGLSRHEASRRQVESQFPDLPKDQIDKVTKFATDGQMSSEPTLLTTSNGRTVLSHHDSVGELGVVGITVDITELKQREKELEVAEEKAKVAAEAKSRFLANMSHEIRTPLNGVLGMAEVLSLRNLNADDAECVNVIIDSGKTLMAVVNDILDLSKIEAGKMELVERVTDIGNSLELLKRLWDAKADEKGLDLSLTIAPNVPKLLLFDEVRVRQCISNLVSNAIKFTDEGGVSINVTADLDDINKISIEVIDTGIGLSEDDQRSLFDAFQQAQSSTNREYEGTGLGLTISKNLAQMMGGDLVVESAPGAGARFTLAFKAMTANAASHLREGHHYTDSDCLKGRRVLLVDDNPVNRAVVRAYLTDFNTIIVEAENGQEALEELSMGTPFDVVLLDMHMPVMDGPQTIERIRSPHCPFRDVPVIALTADSMEGDRERYLSMGMDGYISKPLSLSDLLSECARLLCAPPSPAETASDCIRA